VVRIAVVQQVDEREGARGVRLQAEKLLSQDGRPDDDAFSRQIRGRIERQGQLGRARAEEPGINPHANQLLPQFRRPNIARMLEHELMAHGHDWRALAPGQRIQGGDRLKEINDDIRFRPANNRIERADHFRVFGQFGQHPEERGGGADRSAVLIFELQGRQLCDGHLHRRFEVFRNRPVRAHSERDGDDLMPCRVRHFLHRHRLSHVAATLAENAEHHLHESELI